MNLLPLVFEWLAAFDGDIDKEGDDGCLGGHGNLFDDKLGSQ